MDKAPFANHLARLYESSSPVKVKRGSEKRFAVPQNVIILVT